MPTGTTYYPTQAQAQKVLPPDVAGAAVQFAPGKGYYIGTPSAGGSSAINAAIQQMINAQSAPIVNAQNRYNAQAQQQQTNITGLTQALAGILGGIAPGVEKTYADAATRQSGFAKGFSDQMQEALGRNADNTSSFLQNIVGAPQSQVDQVRGQVAPAAAGDTLYGLQGYIPASTLNREGAAFTAAAKQLPGIANSQGLQQIAKVQSAQRDEQSKTSDKLAELAGTIPKLRSDLEQQAFDRAYKTHSANLQDAKFAFDKTYKVGQANFQVDKFNAQQALGYQKMAQQAYQSDRTYRVSLANLGIAQKKAQIAALAAEAKLKNGGFTPVQVTKFTGTANSIAEDAFKGIPKFDKSGNVVTKNGQTVWDAPPLDYKAALREMKKSHSGVGSVPLSIATAALNQWYTNPGARGRPLSERDWASFGAASSALTNPAGALKGGALTQIASQFLGVPYKWGGNNAKSGLDCSAFVQQVYKQLGVNLPRTTYDQVKQGSAVMSLDQLQPGDLIFTRPGKRGPNHVGLYVGNGQVQESPHTGDVNKVIDLQSYLSGGLVAIRRIVG